MGDIEIYPVAESPSFSGIFLPTAFWCLFLFFFLCPLQSRHIRPSLYCCSQSGTIRETFVLHAALSNVRSSLCPCQGCQCQLGLTFISATRFCVITSFSSGVAEGKHAKCAHAVLKNASRLSQPRAGTTVVWTAHGRKSSMRSVPGRSL